MTKLYSEHLVYSDGIQHTRVHQLAELDHRPTIQDTRVVESSSDDHAYLVSRVECLPEPFDPDTTDSASDRIAIIVCSCPGHYYHCSGGFEDGENPPTGWGECRHASVFREVRAKQDDKQDTLGE
jgi:hypothetical protein